MCHDNLEHTRHDERYHLLEIVLQARNLFLPQLRLHSTPSKISFKNGKKKKKKKSTNVNFKT